MGADTDDNYVQTCIHGKSLQWYCEDCGSLNGTKLRAKPYGYGTSRGEPISAETIDHPAHYSQGSIECIDAIEAALTPEEFKGFCKGNAMKYEWREKHKGGAESIKKAIWYLQRLLKVKI